MNLIRRSKTVLPSGGTLVTPWPTDGLTDDELSDAKEINEMALQEITRPAPVNQARTVDVNKPTTANIV